MLNDAGGVVIDDLIIYYLNETTYRTVISGTAKKDLAWMAARQSPIGAEPGDYPARRDGNDPLGMIAVQGPMPRPKVWEVLPRQIDYRKPPLLPACRSAITSLLPAPATIR